MPSTVLIVTNDHDEHADAVIEELHRRDVPVFRFHPEEFPDAYSISIEIQDGRIDGEIRSEHRQVAFRDICAAWYRRSRRLFAPPPTLNPLYGDVDNFVKMQATFTRVIASGELDHSRELHDLLSSGAVGADTEPFVRGGEDGGPGCRSGHARASASTLRR